MANQVQYYGGPPQHQQQTYRAEQYRGQQPYDNNNRGSWSDQRPPQQHGERPYEQEQQRYDDRNYNRQTYNAPSQEENYRQDYGRNQYNAPSQPSYNEPAERRSQYEQPRPNEQPRSSDYHPDSGYRDNQPVSHQSDWERPNQPQHGQGDNYQRDAYQQPPRQDHQSYPQDNLPQRNAARYEQNVNQQPPRDSHYDQRYTTSPNNDYDRNNSDYNRNQYQRDNRQPYNPPSPTSRHPPPPSNSHNPPPPQMRQPPSHENNNQASRPQVLAQSAPTSRGDSTAVFGIVAKVGRPENTNNNPPRQLGPPPLPDQRNTSGNQQTRQYRQEDEQRSPTRPLAPIIEQQSTQPTSPGYQQHQRDSRNFDHNQRYPDQPYDRQQQPVRGKPDNRDRHDGYREDSSGYGSASTYTEPSFDGRPPQGYQPAAPRSYPDQQSSYPDRGDRWDQSHGDQKQQVFHQQEIKRHWTLQKPPPSTKFDQRYQPSDHNRDTGVDQSHVKSVQSVKSLFDKPAASIPIPKPTASYGGNQYKNPDNRNAPPPRQRVLSDGDRQPPNHPQQHFRPPHHDPHGVSRSMTNLDRLQVNPLPENRNSYSGEPPMVVGVRFDNEKREQPPYSPPSRVDQRQEYYDERPFSPQANSRYENYQPSWQYDNTHQTQRRSPEDRRYNQNQPQYEQPRDNIPNKPQSYPPNGNNEYGPQRYGAKSPPYQSQEQNFYNQGERRGQEYPPSQSRQGSRSPQLSREPQQPPIQRNDNRNSGYFPENDSHPAQPNVPYEEPSRDRRSYTQQDQQPDYYPNDEAPRKQDYYQPPVDQRPPQPKETSYIQRDARSPQPTYEQRQAEPARVRQQDKERPPQTYNQPARDSRSPNFAPPAPRDVRPPETYSKPISISGSVTYLPPVQDDRRLQPPSNKANLPQHDSKPYNQPCDTSTPHADTRQVRFQQCQQDQPERFNHTQAQRQQSPDSDDNSNYVPSIVSRSYHSYSQQTTDTGGARKAVMPKPPAQPDDNEWPEPPAQVMNQSRYNNDNQAHQSYSQENRTQYQTRQPPPGRDNTRVLLPPKVPRHPFDPVDEDDDDSSEGIDVDAPTPPPQPQNPPKKWGSNQQMNQRPEGHQRQHPAGARQENSYSRQPGDGLNEDRFEQNMPNRTQQGRSIPPNKPKRNSLRRNETPPEETAQEVYDWENHEQEPLSHDHSKDRLRVAKARVSTRKPPSRATSANTLVEEDADSENYEITVTPNDLRKVRRSPITIQQNNTPEKPVQGKSKPTHSSHNQAKASKPQQNDPRHRASAESKPNPGTSKLVFKVPGPDANKRPTAHPLPDIQESVEGDKQKPPTYSGSGNSGKQKDKLTSDLLGQFKSARDNAWKTAAKKQEKAFKALSGFQKRNPSPVKSPTRKPETVADKNASKISHSQPARKDENTDIYNRNKPKHTDRRSPDERSNRTSLKSSSTATGRRNSDSDSTERGRNSRDRGRSRARSRSRDRDLSPGHRDRGRSHSRDRMVSPDRRRGPSRSRERNISPPRRGRSRSRERNISPPRRGRSRSRERIMSPERRSRDDIDRDSRARKSERYNQQVSPYKQQREDPNYPRSSHHHPRGGGGRGDEPEWVEEYRRRRAHDDPPPSHRRAWVNDPRWVPKKEKEFDINEYERVVKRATSYNSDFEQPQRQQLFPSKLMAKNPPPSKRPPTSQNSDWMKNLKEHNKRANQRRYGHDT